MIHSMCGGELKDNEVISFVKIEFIDNPLAEKRPYWYKSAVPGLTTGDKVLAPFGKNDLEYAAVVIRVDRVSEQTPPMPVARMGTISKKIDD